MKLKNQTTVYLKKRVVQKGKTDGEKYVTFSENAIELKATVYSKLGKLVAGQSGYVQQYQKKLLCDEPFTISNENGVETYWFRNGEFCMCAGDGVCIYTKPEQNPDYKIVAIFPVGHLKIMLEKL